MRKLTGLVLLLVLGIGSSFAKTDYTKILNGGPYPFVILEDVQIEFGEVDQTKDEVSVSLSGNSTSEKILLMANAPERYVMRALFEVISKYVDMASKKGSPFNGTVVFINEKKSLIEDMLIEEASSTSNRITFKTKISAIPFVNKSMDF